MNIFQPKQVNLPVSQKETKPEIELLDE